MTISGVRRMNTLILILKEGDPDNERALAVVKEYYPATKVRYVETYHDATPYLCTPLTGVAGLADIEAILAAETEYPIIKSYLA